MSRATRKAAPAAVPPAPADAGRTLNLILARLDDMKAEETITIDLRGQSSITDYMVVATGRANRHVGAIAEHVVKDLHDAGIKGVHVEGMPNCDWVLIDAGDVIVHVFRPEVRAFYNLEKMWAAARTAQPAS
ncbi:MAG: ribosome silencing factor [Xanthobacteraceae bacterium]|nr:MAG: ribosome silencing factor [Xanthobacteraceae bacterium]